MFPNFLSQTERLSNKALTHQSQLQWCWDLLIFFQLNQFKVCVTKSAWTRGGGWGLTAHPEVGCPRWAVSCIPQTVFLFHSIVSLE